MMLHERSLRGLFMGLVLASAGFCGSAVANPTMLFDLTTGQVIEHQEAFRRWYARLNGAQRNYGPLLVVFCAGLALSLVGAEPWAAFNRVFSSVVLAAFQALLHVTDLSWSWL